MSTPYIGEIRMFGGSFAPVGWMFCDGSLLAISQYDALFSLIGTTYGGDGQSTFALPNLCGRLPIHQGQGPGLSNRVIGEAAGAEAVTLSVSQLPAHNHIPVANQGGGNSDSPVGSYWSGSATTAQFVPGSESNTTMNAGTVPPTGGNAAHGNMQPFLAVSFIIATDGVYPTQG